MLEPPATALCSVDMVPVVVIVVSSQPIIVNLRLSTVVETPPASTLRQNSRIAAPLDPSATSAYQYPPVSVSLISAAFEKSVDKVKQPT